MEKLGSLKLRDMRHSREEKKDHGPMAVSEYSGPEFPYGLRLHLDDHELKKLEIGMPAVGQQFRVVGSGKVKSCSASDSEDGERRHVEIQLEQLLLVPVEPVAVTVADLVNPMESALKRVAGE